MKKLLSGVRTPVNMMNPMKPTEENPLIFVPAEGNYIEILGHRIEGFDSWESFLEYLNKRTALDEENKTLKVKIDRLHVEKTEFIEYLQERYEECVLDRRYVDGVWIFNPKEQIYQEILDKVMKG